MKKLILVLSLMATFLLTSCATTRDLTSYNETPANMPHATIAGKFGMGLLTHSLSAIKKIDGRNVTPQWSGTYRISPGSHTIQVLIDQSNYSSDVSATISLHFSAVSGQKYLVKGDVDSVHAAAWVVDGRGRIVSAKAYADTTPSNSTPEEVSELSR